MSNYLDSVNRSKNYNNYKLTADKVIQILSGVKEEKKKSRRRWIWELMQNAKDVPNKYGAVTVKIILDNDKFVFSHNGNPFQIVNITGLIQQVSQKPSSSSDDKVTGKFGTGFISTHLLSEVVTVKGVISEELLPHKSFELEINRRAENSEDMIEAIADELELIEKIDDNHLFPVIYNYENNRTEECFDTSFTYKLENEESKEAARVGVDDLESTLPQTLFFIKELKKVIIYDKVKGNKTTYELFENGNIHDIYFPLIKVVRDGNEENLHFIHLKNVQYDLAVPVNNHVDRVITTLENSPRLYRDFPLVGTEKFYFPFILNGKNFYPTERRDSILLTDKKNSNVQTNRNILSQAIQSAKYFVEWLIDNNSKNLSHLAQSRVPSSLSEQSVIDWYVDEIQTPYRRHLVDQKIVETSDVKIKLRNAIIPKFKGVEKLEQFWEILRVYFGSNQICRKEDLRSWQDNLGVASEINTWQCQVFYTIENLLEDIQSKVSLSHLKIDDNNTTTIQWLNSVYNFIIENDLNIYFKQYKILPTIKGDFKSLNDEIFIEKDQFIPDEFIHILKSLNQEDWHEILLHRSLIEIDGSHASKSISDISDEINKIIRDSSSYYSFIDRDDASTILLDLLCICEDDNSFQSVLFQLANKFFNSDHKILKIAGTTDFNFYHARSQMINLLNTKIQDVGSLDELEINKKEDWLLKYLLHVQQSNRFKTQLEGHKIFPNRKGELCLQNEIFAYGTNENPLDDKLIEILYQLNPSKNWDEFLIHDMFRDLQLIPKDIETLTRELKTEMEALKIEDGYSSKSNTILELIHWCSESPNKEIADQYLDWFLLQKDKIFVNISLEDTVVGGNIVKLLSKKEDLPELVAIVDSGVDLNELSEVAELAKDIGIEKIQALALEVKEEKDDFEFKKNIGNNIEMVFQEAFEAENLPFKIEYQGIGSQDFVISNPLNSKSFFIELKSLSQNNNDNRLKLSILQAKKAVEQKDSGNYVVSVLVRPNTWHMATTRYLKENLNSQFDLGFRLSNAIEKNNIYERLISSYSEIDLEFEDNRRKVVIAESIWKQSGYPFDTLINRIKRYLA